MANVFTHGVAYACYMSIHYYNSIIIVCLLHVHTLVYTHVYTRAYAHVSTAYASVYTRGDVYTHISRVMAHVGMAYTVMADVVMAYVVVAYVVVAYMVMADIVMAYVVMAYIAMACIVMAYIVMAYIIMAYIKMAHTQGGADSSDSPWRVQSMRDRLSFKFRRWRHTSSAQHFLG